MKGVDSSIFTSNFEILDFSIEIAPPMLQAGNLLKQLFRSLLKRSVPYKYVNINFVALIGRENDFYDPF